MPRLAFYSHDTMGLGHVRRNLLLAQALTARAPATTVLLISGTHVGAAFRMPPNVDCLTLPALAKSDEDGAYGARHLGITLTRMTRLRGRAMRAAILAFDPDLLVVDTAPRGAMGEAEPTLAALKAHGRARLVLGLRDVLDDPDTVGREWRRCGYHEAIARYYDQVWVYGDPAVYDLGHECRFPSATSSKIRYVGYLDRSRTAVGAGQQDAALTSLPHDFALCMSGGGQDGSAVAMAFAAARGCGVPRVILGGPFLPDDTRQALHDCAAADADLHVVDFCSDPTPLIERAARLVTMGGYNSVCEALAYRKETLIVPREWPRREQAIRAARLEALGVADVLPMSRVSAHALRDWLTTSRARASPSSVRFDALERVPALVSELLDAKVFVNSLSSRGRRLLAS